MTPKQFLAWEKASQDTIDVKRCYIDIAGDLVAGVVLSQIIYWYLPSKNGNSKIRVFKDGIGWIAKERKDWWEECRISEKRLDRAREILEKLKIVEFKNFRFNNEHTLHCRVIWENFLPFLEKIINEGVISQVDERVSSEVDQKVISQVDERVSSLTKTTTEITNIDVKISDISKGEAEISREIEKNQDKSQKPKNQKLKVVSKKIEFSEEDWQLAREFAENYPDDWGTVAGQKQLLKLKDTPENTKVIEALQLTFLNKTIRTPADRSQIVKACNNYFLKCKFEKTQKQFIIKPFSFLGVNGNNPRWIEFLKEQKQTSEIDISWYHPNVK